MAKKLLFSSTPALEVSASGACVSSVLCGSVRARLHCYLKSIDDVALVNYFFDEEKRIK